MNTLFAEEDFEKGDDRQSAISYDPPKHDARKEHKVSGESNTALGPNDWISRAKEISDEYISKHTEFGSSDELIDEISFDKPKDRRKPEKSYQIFKQLSERVGEKFYKFWIRYKKETSSYFDEDFVEFILENINDQ